MLDARRWPAPQPDGTLPRSGASALDSLDGLRSKVAFLSRPESYPERPASVEVVQTHMSCVFLTERHAYKLKKPVRFEFLDFSTLAARRASCEEELRLNRRLAPGVYLDVVPLALGDDGYLALGGDGEVVEWLVRMRRLPARSMLDRAIREQRVTPEDVRRFTRVLADFYRRAEPVAVDPLAYRRGYASGIAACRRELSVPDYGLPPAAAATALQEALERLAPCLERRASERRLVEAHGDLRPEHVCLAPEPLFIDCLEFNRDWRILDPADELSYLAMECEHAGAPWIGDVVLEEYREATGDDPAAPLLAFYRAYRAFVRAKLAAWHLRDRLEPAEQGRWIGRAQRYLELAVRCPGARAAATP